MFGAFEWKMALRYLRLRGSEAFVAVIALFSLLGMAIGVAALIVTMAVMNGFHNELLSKVISFKGHILFQPYGGKMSDYDKAVKILEKYPNVVHVSPVIDGQALASFGDYTAPAFVMGVRPADLRKMTLVSENIKQGSMDDFGKQDDDIFIGQLLANNYNLRVGDDISLMIPKGSRTPFGIIPRVKRFTIRGIFSVGEFNYDTGYFFVPLKTAQKLFNYKDRVGYLEVFLTHPNLITETFPQMVEQIDKLGVSGRFLDWQQVHKSFFNALQMERTVMFIILSLIVVVAAFNVISTMIMLVRSKVKDIAILRTIGASKSSILRIFLIIGSSIGVVGTFLGVTLGVALTLNLQSIVNFVEEMTGRTLWDAEVRMIREIPTDMQVNEVFWIVLTALALTFLSTIFPAMKAAKTDPVEALRYE
jgi:lipoprotein-releasing system permease protein